MNELQNRHQSKNPWHLVLIVMVVAGLPLLVIGFIMVQKFGDVYRHKITDHLTVLVAKHSRTIDTFLIDRLGDIRVLARSHSAAELKNQIYLTKMLAVLRE